MMPQENRVTTVRRRLARRIAIAATVLMMSPALAGCWNGFGASTSMQNSMNTGNGTQTIVGSLRIENATIVRNDSGRASLIVAVFNQGDAPDTLIGVTVNDQPVATDPVTIEPGSYATFGYGAEGAPMEHILLIDPLETPTGSYAQVSLAFTTNGISEFVSLVVPDTGYYAGFVPAG